MRVLIIEDELLLAKQLMTLLKSFEPAIILEGPCNSIDSSVEWLQSNPAPELILMDIELADGQCFDIFQRVELDVPVIFTTAYDEYTLRAFKVNSIDYLLKPIREQELRNAIEKFRKLSMHTMPMGIGRMLKDIYQSQNTHYRERFLVKHGQKMIPIPIEDIAFFFTRGGLSYLVTKSKQKYVLDYTLDEIEESVSPKDFIRANRQFIISGKTVKMIHPWFNGKLKVELDQPVEEDLIISREKAAAFREWLGE